MNPIRWFLFVSCVAYFGSFSASGKPGDIEAGFDPNVAGSIASVATQPDGRIIIGGSFTKVGGVARRAIARLNPDGTLDTGFAPSLGTAFDNTMVVRCVAVQEDGKILAGVSNEPQGGAAFYGIFRFNPDGTNDAFAHSTQSTGFALQADGKILVSAREPIRLNPDGTIDPSFTSVIWRPLSAIQWTAISALQDDGRILISGVIFSGQKHAFIKRLNTSGGVQATLLDFTGIQPAAGGVIVQPDGRLLLSVAEFGGGRSVVRLDANGALESSFNPDVGPYAGASALQADGKFMVGGGFTTVDGVPRNHFARLFPDGSLDTAFEPNLGLAPGVTLQADGRAVISGWFSTVGGVARNSMARLESDAATQSLTVPDSSRVQWLRGGTSPETNQVSFDLSTDSGVTWTRLGAGTRIAGGWELGGLNLPAAYQVRARARIHQGLVETLTAFPDVSFVPTLLAPATGAANNGFVSFSLPEAALPGSVTLTFDDGTTPRVLTLDGSQGSWGGHSFTFNPADPTAAPQVASGGAVPEGTYSVTLRYQDAAGNPAATAAVTNVTIDTTAPSIGGTFSQLTIATDLYGTAQLPNYATQAVASDNLSAVTIKQTPTPYTRMNAGTTQVTLTARDAAGNTASTSFTVTVNDATPPAIGGTFTPLALTVGADGMATLPDYASQALTSDNVGVTQKTQTPSAGTSIGVGTTHVVVTAMDAAGNSASKSLDVVVSDGTPPTISGTFSPLAFPTGAAGTAALPDYTEQAVTSDNVGVTSVDQSPVAGSPRSVGTTQVTLTARDGSGNSASTSFAVTVSDGTPPTIGGTFSPLTAMTGAGGTATLSEYTTQAVTSDNVGVTLKTQSPAPGSLIGVGTTHVVLTAHDAAGNSASKAFDVLVSDGTPPMISGTFSPLELTAGAAGTAALPDYTGQAVTSDNVGVTSVVQSPAAGSPRNFGTTHVTITARDAVGNASQVGFDVKVGIGAVLALNGASVPGAGVDPRIPVGATWGPLGVPSITAQGTKAGWLAVVRTPIGSFHGIFSGPLGAPVLRLKTGDAATDATGAAVPGVSFKSFREPVFAGDDFAMVATVAGRDRGHDTGLWINAGGTLREVALEGANEPGPIGNRFKAITSFAMPKEGVVYFTGTLAAPAKSDRGLWVWSSGTMKWALQENYMGSGRLDSTPKSIRALSAVKGSPGHGRYDDSEIDVHVLMFGGRETVGLVNETGNYRSALTTGDSVLDRAVCEFGVPSSPGDGARPAVRVRIILDPTAGITAADNEGIFDGQQSALLARKGTTAPGAEFATFKSFLDPVCGYDWSSTRTAFFAAKLSGGPRALDFGLWAYTDSLTRVALEGVEPPSAPGTKWKDFTSLTVQEGRGPMFVATLASSGERVTAKNDTGLWATDSTGALRLILRTGDTVEGKTLRHFDVLGAVAGSPGQRRAWTSGDPSARVIYRAFFTDGSSAIVSTAVP